MVDFVSSGPEDSWILVEPRPAETSGLMAQARVVHSSSDIPCGPFLIQEGPLGRWEAREAARDLNESHVKAGSVQELYIRARINMSFLLNSWREGL